MAEPHVDPAPPAPAPPRNGMDPPTAPTAPTAPTGSIGPSPAAPGPTGSTGPSPAARRAICDTCGARGWLEPGQDRSCVECGGPYRRMALLEGLVDRFFAPPAQHVSELYPRHLKLVELMWTSEGRGREMYEALAPEKVSYTQFVTRATQVVVRGLAEGWIEIDLPRAPTPDDGQYQVRFVDADRWADELTATFFGPEASGQPDHGSSTAVEGDPDLA